MSEPRDWYSGSSGDPGGPLAANPVMATGLTRIGEAAKQIHEGHATRTLGHATSGSTRSDAYASESSCGRYPIASPPAVDHHDVEFADTPHTVWNPVTPGAMAASTRRPTSPGESQISAPRRVLGCSAHQPIRTFTTVIPYRSWYIRPKDSTAALLHP